MESVLERYIATSTDETANEKVITVDFGGKKRLAILNLSIYNATNPFTNYTVGYTISGQYLPLRDVIGEPNKGGNWSGPLIVEADGLFFANYGCNASDVIDYFGAFEEVRGHER